MTFDRVPSNICTGTIPHAPEIFVLDFPGFPATIRPLLLEGPAVWNTEVAAIAAAAGRILDTSLYCTLYSCGQISSIGRAIDL